MAAFSRLRGHTDPSEEVPVVAGHVLRIQQLLEQLRFPLPLVGASVSNAFQHIEHDGPIKLPLQTQNFAIR